MLACVIVLVLRGIAPLDGKLWVSLATPHTYVYDTGGDKVRAVQFNAAGAMAPADSFFSGDRLLVAPGCYAFNWRCP